jgi:NTP pyrophosphatase (non-canonical NTP hydrolase)
VWRSLAARFVRDEEAVGSNPATPTAAGSTTACARPERPAAGAGTLRFGAMDIAEFQQLIADLYGERDRERGVTATVAWLCEELGELAQAVRKGDAADQQRELGDVLAWLASLADQLDLSLDDAVRRYVSAPPPPT